jgi:hypothetical protein
VSALKLSSQVTAAPAGRTTGPPPGTLRIVFRTVRLVRPGHIHPDVLHHINVTGLPATVIALQIMPIIHSDDSRNPHTALAIPGVQNHAEMSDHHGTRKMEMPLSEGDRRATCLGAPAGQYKDSMALLTGPGGYWRDGQHPPNDGRIDQRAALPAGDEEGHAGCHQVFPGAFAAS